MLSLVATVKLKLKGVRVYNVSLKIAFIFFAKVLTKRLNLTVSPRVLDCTRDFKLILFICSLKLRINPKFFDSFRQNKCHLGLLKLKIVFLNAVVTMMLDVAAPVDLPSVMNVLYKTAAGAPTLNTTRRALGRLNRPADKTTLDYTIACPLKIIKIVFTVIIVEGFFMHPSSVRRRRRSSSGRACVTAFRVRGPTVFGGDVRSVTRMNCPGFIVSQL